MRSWLQNINNTENASLYFVTLVMGVVGMMLEMATPRLFSPYFGTSTFIWNNVIGVVMASLATGYFLGGKLTERKVSRNILTLILIFACGLTLLVWASCDPVLHKISQSGLNPLSASLVASIVILVPINILLGIIIPVIISLLTKKEKNTAHVIGNVYALSTIGAIIGTFCSGYWLIPSFGSHAVFFIVAVSILFCGFIASSSLILKLIIVITGLLYNFYGHFDPQKIFVVYYEKQFNVNVLTDFDTKYNRIWVYDKKDKKGITTRVLANSQSSMVLGKSISYTMQDIKSYYSYFNLAPLWTNQFQHVLMIGGGAYTYASYLTDKFPELKIDMAEIDPDLLGVSKDFFSFVPSKNFQNFPVDGRVFLNTNKKKYDVIYLDAYQNGDAMPLQLATQQAYRLMYDSLNDRGLLFVNVISSIDGKGSDLFKSQYGTISSVFDGIHVYPVWTQDVTSSQNIVLVGIKGSDTFEKNVTSDEYYVKKLNLNSFPVEKYVQPAKIITDDFAPVEYYDLDSFL